MDTIFKLRLIILLSVSSFNLIGQQSRFSKIYNNREKLAQEGNIVNGKMYGPWKFYDDSLDYLLKIETYKNDYLDGPYIKFNSSGMIICTGYYSIKAKKDHKEYEASLGGYAYFTEPLPVGVWLYYDNTGKLIRREIYSNRGKIKKKEEFNE